MQWIRRGEGTNAFPEAVGAFNYGEPFDAGQIVVRRKTVVEEVFDGC